MSATAAVADVSVYRDETPWVSKAVVVMEGEASYYADIKLSVEPDGSFGVVPAEQLTPAHADELSIAAESSGLLWIGVQVSGYLPTPRYRIEEPVVTREESIFTIMLAQRPLQTFAPCAQMIEPFSVLVPLSVEGLNSGHYMVIVNDRQSEFDLP